LSKNNLSITVGTGISATSTTQSSSPQHPMQKIGNRRHVPSLHNPHSPLRLDLLKDKSLPWLSFFLLQAPSPKLIHNAFQSVGLSVFAAGAYVITFVGFWQRCVMFKLRTPRQGCPDVSCAVWTAIMCLPNLHFMLRWVVLTHNVTPKLCTEYLVRLILTNLDWVSTVCWHTMLPLSCVWNILLGSL
jgi:hypothetical protein